MTLSELIVLAGLLVSSIGIVVAILVVVPHLLRRTYETRLLEVRHALHMALVDSDIKRSVDAIRLLSAIDARVQFHHLITPAHAFGARWAYRRVGRPNINPAQVDGYLGDEHLNEFAAAVQKADQLVLRRGSVSGWVFTLWRALGGPTPNSQEIVGLILRLQGPPPRQRLAAAEPV